MTFSTEAQNSASERFFLVRITPRKFIGTGTDIGGGQFEFALSSSYIVSQVIINDEVAPMWTHANDVITIDSGLDLTDDVNIVTVDHDIFMTGTKVRNTESVAGLPDAEWLPLIESYPDFSQSMRNIADGVFTLSSSSIDLISVDRWGQSLFGENDSLSHAQVSVWTCINSENINRKIFDGEVSSVNYSYGKIRVEIIDSFNKLQETASFGSFSQSHIYTGNNGQYPNPGDENAIIPLVIGKSSPMIIAHGWNHLDPFGSPNSKTYHITDGLRAMKISPQTPNNSSSITFSCARVVGSGVKRLNFGTISAAYEQWISRGIPRSESDNASGNLTIYDRIIYLQCSTFNGEVGDYIPQLNGWVCGHGSGLWGSYNVAVAPIDYGYSQNDGENIAPSSGSISVPSIPNNSIPSMSVWIDGGDSINYQTYYYPLALIPSATQRNHSKKYLKFSISETSQGTVGDQPITLITATVDPTANDLNNAGISNILASGRVMFRLSPSQAMSHGDAMKFIISSSGMTPNNSSFSQADTDLSANVSLTTPISGGNTFSKFLDLAQKITTSTLSILKVNESREVEYSLIKNVTSDPNAKTRDPQNILNQSTSSNIQFQDIVTSVKFENEQLKGQNELSGSGANAVVDFPKLKQLHRVNKSKTISHCLESIQNRKTAIAGYLSSPTVEYTLATSSEDLSSVIGDVIEITNTAAASSAQTVRGIIIGLNQGGSKTSVKINEIRGVP